MLRCVSLRPTHLGGQNKMAKGGATSTLQLEGKTVSNHPPIRPPKKQAALFYVQKKSEELNQHYS